MPKTKHAHFNQGESKEPAKGIYKLPNRWQKYSSLGRVVSGTRFLPFKTPLNEEICRRSLRSCDWFTPAMLLEKAPRIKFVIDLTQTGRFYDVTYLKRYGVRHLKIICPGGGKTLPPAQIVQKFKEAVDNFLTSEDGLNPDSLIGVHCTHGLNRTGYLICKDMIERYGVTARAAIYAFEQARGHTMERQLYVDDILKGSLTTLPVEYHGNSARNECLPIDNWRSARGRENENRRYHPYSPTYGSRPSRQETTSSSYNWRNREPDNYPSNPSSERVSNRNR